MLAKNLLMMSNNIYNDTAHSRFELAIDNQIVFARYARDADVLSILHVESPPQLRGTGAAGKLMQGIVDYSKEHQLTLDPVCGYARHWLTKNSS